MFSGISGFGGFLGLLLQIFLLVLAGRFLFRMFVPRREPPSPAAKCRPAAPPPAGPARWRAAAGRRRRAGCHSAPADYQAFEHLLQAVQAAWSAHDLSTLRAIATPEMVSYFAEQLAEQTSRGVRNLVTDVHLEQGDLAEAWDGGRPGIRNGGHALLDDRRDARRAGG